MNLSRWPSILALPLAEYFHQGQPVVKLWHACDVVELTLRLLVALGLADLRGNTNQIPKRLLGEFRSRIEMPTLGKWQGMAGAVAKRIRARGGTSVVPEMASLVEDVLFPMLDGPDKDTAAVETSFKMLRNQLAHGGGVSRSVAAGLLDQWAPRFESFLVHLEWLTEICLLVKNGDHQSYGCLRGPAIRPEPFRFSRQDVAVEAAVSFQNGAEVLLFRQDKVLTLWPLITYTVPRSLQQNLSTRPVPQIYLRRGAARLEMTPIGSDEACQSIADEAALNVFIELFHLKERGRTREFLVRDFEGEISHDAQNLVGRADELIQIAEALRESVLEPDTRPGCRVLWLTGEAGIGKSYLLAYLADQLAGTENPKQVIVSPKSPGSSETLVEFPDGTTILAYRFRNGDDRCSMLAFLTFALERLTGSVGENPEGGHGVEELKKKNLASLHKHLDRRDDRSPPLVFILDGLEEISELEESFVEEVPMALLFPGVTWLCAGRPTAHLSRLFTGDKCRMLLPDGLRMRLEDVRTMLLEGLAGSMRDKLIDKDREAGNRVLNPFIERVAAYADGLPIYVHYVLDDAANNRLTDFDENAPLPESIKDYHNRLIGHLSLDGAWYITPHITAMLAVAREPLTAEALTDLLIQSYLLPEDAESPALVKAGLSALGSVVCRADTPEGDEGFTIFHRSFRQHIMSSSETKTPILLAQSAFCRLAGLPNGMDRPGSRYLFRWGITHLVEAGKSVEAVGLLTDFHYLIHRIMRLGRNGVMDAGADWRLVAKAATLASGPAVWEEFWRTREHLLLQGNEFWPPHKIFLQLAWEHAAQSPVSMAAEQWLAQGHCTWAWMRIKEKQRPLTVRQGSLRRVLHGQGEDVTAIALLPGRSKILSGGFGGSLRLWDAASGESIGQLRGHTGLVKPLRLARNGRIAVSGSFDHRLGVWDLETGERLHMLEGHDKPVLDVAVTENGALAVSVGQDRTLRVWDLTAGRCLRVLRGHKGLIRSVILLPGDAVAVSASLDKTVRVWDLEKGECINLLRGHRAGLAAVAAMEGGAKIVSAGRDAVLLIWDVFGREKPLTLEGHQDNVDLLAVTPDERFIISASWDHTIRIWDAAEGRCRHVLTTNRAKIEDLVLTQDGKRLITGGSGGAISVWEIETGRLLQVLEGNTGGVLALDIQGETLVSGGADQAVAVWNLEVGGSRSIDGHRGHIISVTALPDHDRIMSTAMDGVLRVWDQNTGQCLKTVKGGIVWYKHAMARHGEDLWALTSEENGDLSLWSLVADRRLKILTPSLGGLSAAGMSPDGTTAFGARGRGFMIWDLESGATIGQMSLKKAALTASAVDWTHQRLLAGFSNGGLVWWDMRAGRDLARVRSGQAAVKALSLSRDGTKAAVVKSDGWLNLWDLERKELVTTIEGLPPTTEELVLDPDAKTAVSFGPDLILRIWNLGDGRCERAVGISDAPAQCPDAYSLLYPARGSAKACVWNRHDLGMVLYRRDVSPVVWCAGYVWQPLMTGGAVVFERVGSISVLRVLELIQENHVIDWDDVLTGG